MKAKVFIGDNEEEVIKDFHSFLKEFKNPTLSGFNFQFDVSNIKLRFIKNELEPIHIFGSKYEYLDTKDMLDSSYMAKGTLDEYLKLLKIPLKYNNYTGADVHRLYQEKKWEELEKYSLQDAISEHILLQRILKYEKKKYNMDEVITVDIETIGTLQDKYTEEEYKILYEMKLRKKYKRQSDITKNLNAFDWDKICQESALDKINNRIIAISCAWESGEEVEVDTERDQDDF